MIEECCITLNLGDHLLSTYAKFSEKLISNLLIRIRTCAYQGVPNISFSKYFAYIMDDP